MKFRSSFLHALKLPTIPLGLLSSYIGMKVALNHAVDREPDIWAKDFKDQRVLVVGSGPSLDKVKKDYFANFDAVICINHAILQVPEHPCLYYLSTDAPRTYQVLKTEAAGRIREMPREKRILLLSLVRLTPNILRGFFSLFTVIRYKSYHIHQWGRWFKPVFYQPMAAPDPEVIDWINGRTKIDSMPSRGGSSAFSAILLAARYRPAEICLIGVDLDSGRASRLRAKAGSAAFGGQWARERFLRLQVLVRQCGIEIKNDSWKEH